MGGRGRNRRRVHRGEAMVLACYTLLGTRQRGRRAQWLKRGQQRRWTLHTCHGRSETAPWGRRLHYGKCVYSTAPTRPNGTVNKPRRDNTLQLKRLGGGREGIRVEDPTEEGSVYFYRPGKTRKESRRIEASERRKGMSLEHYYPPKGEDQEVGGGTESVYGQKGKKKKKE